MATILNQNQQDDSNTQDELNPTTPGLSPTTMSNTPSAAPTQQRQGSGRFTNLQKYISANQQAGQNLIGNVTNKVQGQVDSERKKADEALGQIRSGIEQGRQGLEQGRGFQSQLGQIGQNISAQTSTDTNKAFANRDLSALGIDQFNNDDYQKFQQGQNVDETRLGLQQQNFARTGQGLLGASQQAMQNLSSDEGRFNLIKNTFGKNVNPNYSVGQQRLDQLFLAQNPLSDLRKNISDTTRTAQQYLGNATQFGQDVKNISQTEKDLIGANLGLSRANTDSYLNMLGSYTGELNQQRANEFQKLQDQLSSLKMKDLSTGFQKATPANTNPNVMDTATLQRLGLKAGPQQVFNVFNTLKNTDVANKGRDAANYQDVATQADVDKYAALAKIAGIDPTRLTQSSQLGNAWESKTGSDSLQSRINQAKQNFERDAALTFTKDDPRFMGRHVQPGKRIWSEFRPGTLDNILKGNRLEGGDRGWLNYDNVNGIKGQRQSEVFANQVFDQALQRLQSEGYGNVLDLNNPQTINALQGLNINDINANDQQYAIGEFNQGSNGALSRYGTNLDEIVAQRMKNAGILNKYSK